MPAERAPTTSARYESPTMSASSRVTFALSLAAIIFSFVSLTLSQSVRGQLLGMKTPASETHQIARHSAPAPQAPVAQEAPAQTASLIPSANASEPKSIAKIPVGRKARAAKKK